MGSILKFFQGSNPSNSSSKQASDKLIDGGLPLSPSGSESCSGQNQADQSSGPPYEEQMLENVIPSTNQVEQSSGPPYEEQMLENVIPSTNQVERGSDAWEYKPEEIDPTVINELPPEIQLEVRGWLRPFKRANTSKRGSSIAHYFLPAKKSEGKTYPS